MDHTSGESLVAAQNRVRFSQKLKIGALSLPISQNNLLTPLHHLAAMQGPIRPRPFRMGATPIIDAKISDAIYRQYRWDNDRYEP